MKSFHRIATPFVILIAIVGVSVFAYSMGDTPDVLAQNVGGPGANQELELKNPLRFDSVNAFVLAIIDVVLIFLIPVIVLYIMYAGFLFVKAQGNPGEISEAKKALLTALVGGVIVLGARAILDVVKGTIDAIIEEPAAVIDHIPYV